MAALQPAPRDTTDPCAKRRSWGPRKADRLCGEKEEQPSEPNGDFFAEHKKSPQAKRGLRQRGSPPYTILLH